MAKKKSTELDFSTLKLKLKKPFEYDGQTHTEMKFDFDKLTGEDFIDVETEMRTEGVPRSSINGESIDFRCRLAAKASGIGSDVLKKLPGNYFNQIMENAWLFLNYMESSVDET